MEKAFKMAPADIVEEVKRSGLRGRGGAGFPTGMKWSFLAKPEGVPRYLVCNADESEPGTFKDRYLMEFLPHLLIEGLIISSFALGSNRTYIYIRGEYAWIPDILEQAIAEAKCERLSWEKYFRHRFRLPDLCAARRRCLHLRRRNGPAGITGRQTRQPAHQAAVPGHQRLWGCPTVVNNVETLAAVVPIINIGGDEYAKDRYWKNHRHQADFCLRQHQQARHLRDRYDHLGGRIYLQDEYCGGIPNGKRLKACIPGGSSVPILPANLLLKTAKGESA
jgi:NADH-quinone oxidoreductase subunit F